MDISLVGSHGFKNGPVNPKNHEECIAKLTEAIEFCAEAGYKRVITFTGMQEKGIDQDQAQKKLFGMLEKNHSSGRKEKNNSLLGTSKLKR